MAEVAYNVGKTRVANNLLDLDGANLRLLLLSVAPAGTFDPDIATITALLAVATTVETSGTGYVRKTLSATVTQDNVNNRANVSATNVTYTAAAFAANAVAAVIYDEGGGTDATRYPLAFYDTGFPIATNGGDITLVLTSDFLRLT